MAQIGALPGGNLRTGRLIMERVEERDLLKFLDLLRRRHLTGYPLMAFLEINDISSRFRLALDLACTRKSFPQRRLRRDDPSITRTAADRFKMGLRPLKPGACPQGLETVLVSVKWLLCQQQKKHQQARIACSRV